MATTTTTGSADVQGRLWSARSDDWATIMEPIGARAVYDDVLERLAVGPDTKALDVGSQSLEEARRALVAKVGENIAVRRFDVFTNAGTVGTYIHMNRIGVVVELERGSSELARDLAMQVAAT